MNEPRPQIEDMARAVTDSYQAEPLTTHINAGPLPGRYRGIELLEMIRNLMFPGYFTEQSLSNDRVFDYAVRLIGDIRETMEQLVEDALAYELSLHGLNGVLKKNESTADAARRIADQFLTDVPKLRQLLALDAQAAYDGDPAARHTDETIFCYPGVDAVFTYRVAHCLHTHGVPLLPRLLSEYVHNETGIDIHPAADIGESFFIDHGTGVVIGETTVIGNRVKLYQGVTLGALSFPKDERGRLIRGTKRHPTLENDVVIYANATILGGETTIGAGSIIGAGVFLAKSVPPGHFVTMKTQELKYRSAKMHDRMRQPGSDKSKD